MRMENPIRCHQTKTKLEPPKPVTTTIFLDKDDKGNVSACEWTEERKKQIPGQTKLDGTEVPNDNVRPIGRATPKEAEQS